MGVNINWAEVVIFIARQTGWSLEYLRQLPLQTLGAIFQELHYQKSMDDYRDSLNRAVVISTMISLWSKTKIKPLEIVGKPPKKEKELKMTDIVKPLEPKIVTLADGKEYTLSPLTLNMLCDAEDKMGQVLPDKPSMKMMRLILFEMAKPNHPEMTIEQIGSIITPEIIKNLNKVLGGLIG